ncbi:hypothetical protein [Actinoallomurus liliacearum]|uniref:hypothetical protein n=1 Tax=Actinoallomurus liliacearum TaxID=1080073 RepID=UPI0031EEAA38
MVTDQFRAVFMLGAEDEVDSVENVDVEVYLSDGTRWSATFMTMREIEKIMDRWRSSGENSGGRYFRSGDLVIVREAGISAMVQTMESALADGGPYSILTPLG